MKNTLIFITCLLQMTALLKAQSFEYIYSTPDDEIIHDAVQNSIGNYFLAGTKGTFLSTTNGIYSGLIIKLNPQGDTLKTLIIPPVNNSLGLDCISKLNDTVFVVFGQMAMPVTGVNQIYYLRIDNDLNILDQKTFGDAVAHETVMKANRTSQNEILLTGFASYPYPDIQIFVYRVSENGDSLQSFYLGDTSHLEFAFDILELPDTSGYLIFTKGWWLPGNSHNQILKVSNSGIIDTIVLIENSGFIIAAKWLNDSTLIIGNGGVDSTGTKLKFSRYDHNLNFISEILMGPPDTNNAEAMYPLDFIDPNKIFAAGTINYQYNWFGNGDPAYYYLIGFNSNLIPQWEKVISHNDDYLNLYKVLATNDSGVMLIGTSYNDQTSGPNERDIYVIKLDSLGNFTTGIKNQTATQVYDVIVYPNPAQDVINIRSTINFPAAEIILYDASGREVMQKKFDKNASFSVKELKEGIYFYKIKDAKGKEERGKVVKE